MIYHTLSWAITVDFYVNQYHKAVVYQLFMSVVGACISLKYTWLEHVFHSGTHGWSMYFTEVHVVGACISLRNSLHTLVPPPYSTALSIRIFVILLAPFYHLALSVRFSCFHQFFFLLFVFQTLFWISTSIFS